MSNIKKNSDKCLKYILAIADIHIKNDINEFDKYDSVFDNLEKSLYNGKYNSGNTLIIIAGDIFHSYEILSPVAIKLIKKLLMILSDICEVVTILGNHDMDRRNFENVNALTSIIDDNLKTKNKIHLLTESGIYDFKNVSFGFTSMFDDIPTIIKKQNKKDGVKYISLYHGIINGCSLNDKFKFTGQIIDKTNSGKFSLKQFGIYDWYIFGDVHKRMFLNKKETAFYCGSLIQQNKSEDKYGGFSEINLTENKYSFYAINNDYITETIIIDENGKTDIDISELSMKPNLEIINNSMNQKNVNNLIKKLESSGRILMSKKILAGNKNTIFNPLIEYGGNKLDLSKITDINTIKNLLVNKLKELDKNITENETLKLTGKVAKILEKVNLSESNKNTIRNIKLLSLEFSNISIYGEDNKIDFSQFNGKNKNLSGLIAQNGYGKSSFIEAIILAIYGKPLRGNIPHVIHNGCDSAETRIQLKINDNIITIERQFLRDGSKNTKSAKKTTKRMVFKQSVKILENNKTKFLETKAKKNKKAKKIIETDSSSDEISEDESDEEIIKTPRIQYDKICREFINNKICTCEELLSTCIVDQVRTESFIFSKKRRQLLYEYAGLDVFKKIVDYVLKEKRSLELAKKKMFDTEKYNDYLLKPTKNTLSCEYFLDLINDIKIKCNDKYKLSKDKFDECNSNLEKMKIDESKLSGILGELDIGEYENIDELENKLNNYNDKLNSKNKELKTIIKHINNDNETLLKLKKEKDKNKYEKSNKTVEDMENLESKIETLTFKLKNEYKDDIILTDSEILNRINELEKIEVHSDFSVNMLNILKDDKHFYEQFYEKINELEDNETFKDCYDYFKMILEKLNDEIRTLEIIKRSTNEMTELKKLRSIHEDRETKKKMNKLKTKIKEIKETEKNKKETYDDLVYNMKNITNNININEERKNKIETELKNIELELKSTTNNIDNIRKNNKKYEKSKKIRDELSRMKMDIDNENTKMKNIKNELDKSDITLQKITFDYDELKNISNKITEMDTDINLYGKIENILSDKSGLLDEVLDKHIVGKLNTIVNSIISTIGLKNVEIKTKKENKVTQISIQYKGFSIVERGGNFETKLLDLIFRIALTQLNHNVKSSWLIIDELLDGCSVENKHYLSKLMSYIKMYYDWILVISHDDAVKESLDNVYSIKKISDTESQINI